MPDKENPSFQEKHKEHEDIQIFANAIRKVKNSFSEDWVLDPFELFKGFAIIVGISKVINRVETFKKALKKEGIVYDDAILDKQIIGGFKHIADAFKGFSDISSTSEVISEDNIDFIEQKWKRKNFSNIMPLNNKVDEGDGEDDCDDNILGFKTDQPYLKLAFRGTNFEIIDGDIVETGVLNEGPQNIAMLVDPDNFKVGEEISLEAQMNYVHTMEDGSTVTYEQAVEANEQGNPVPLQEWTDNVPIEGEYKGQNLGPIIHEVKWWNVDPNAPDSSNVAEMGFKKNLTNAQRLALQKRVSEEAKAKHRILRNATVQNTIEGKKQKVVVSARNPGIRKPHPIARPLSEMPKTSIGFIDRPFSSRGAIVVVLYDGTVIPSNKVVTPFEYTDRDGITQEIGNGVGVMVIQVGTNKKGEPLYGAYPVLDNNEEVGNQRRMANLAKGKFIMSDLLKLYDGIQKGPIRIKMESETGEAVEAMVTATEAKEMIESFYTEGSPTYLGISQGGFYFAGNHSLGFSTSLQEALGKGLPTKNRSGEYSYKVQKNMKGVLVPIFSIKNNRLEVSVKPYEELISEHLFTTNVIFGFTRPDGTEGSTVYPQPRIEFSMFKIDVETVTK